jgi:GTPase SAR1 family protein
VKAILFIVNLAGYNQVLFEDSSKNRIIEELELFEKVTHNELFAKTPIFLFLNKKDLFESMVTEVDMKRTFSDYEGGKNLAPALEYIQDQFKKQLPPGKTVQIQVISARWKRDVKSAFEEVKKTLYDSNRKELIEKANVIRQQERTVKKSQDESGGCCAGGK